MDDQLDAEILQLLKDLEAASQPVGKADLPIYDILRYHLGFVDELFQPARTASGKRIRPKLCLSCCDAALGDQHQAMPVAAAIELLHNFTLIHDDIQDHSLLRRHRPTIWSIWGTAQAINAGDTMFAVSHLALNRVVDRGIPPEVALDLSTAMHETTLRIVEGQVLDLGFENRDDVHVDEYMTMIRGKTAAILGFACAAGATIAGLDKEQSAVFAAFGEALGVGFQILDDELGVWGRSETTGKPEADDIRRRKKALPYLILRESATEQDQHTIDTIYEKSEPDGADIKSMIDLMTAYEVRDEVQRISASWHSRSIERLDRLNIPAGRDNDLRELISVLATRRN